MSDFWSRKLGQPTNQPQQPARPPVVANPVRPWWDTSPAPQPPQQPAQPQPGQVWPQDQVEYRPHQAKSARLDDICPECSSGNFMSPPGTNARKRCFDCGFPFEQTGSSGVSTKGGAPATPSRQIHDGSSNYSPTTIIGRIK